MKAPSRENLTLGAAFALLAVSVAAFGALVFRQEMSPPAPLSPIRLTDATHAAIAPATPGAKNAQWPAPSAQGRGRDWIYDVFTPPEIHYNERSRQFTVKPPPGLVDEETGSFDLELIAVQPEPFRLQLIGYAGGPGNWRGTFQNILSGEVFLAAAGLRIPSLGLSIRQFDVSLQAVNRQDGMTTRQRVATAMVRDERNGRDIVLTHRERHHTDAAFALVAAAGEAEAREVRAGDVVRLGGASYRIERLQISPPVIEVTREAGTLAQPDRRTLSPREQPMTDASIAPSP